MTLDEANKHAEEEAKEQEKCALEHRQLAEWLKELRLYHRMRGEQERQDM